MCKPCVCFLFSKEWDTELARLAQYSSANCEYTRNEHRHDQSNEYDYVGENIAATGQIRIYKSWLKFTWALGDGP